MFALLISATVWSGEPDDRLDYDLFAAASPIGTAAVELRPEAGGKLLLQFWASWCHSCGALMWDMDELVSRNSGIKYVAVSLDDDIAAARHYIRKHRLYEKYSDRYFIDSDKRLSESLGVATVPSIFLVDENGTILLRKSGHLNSADLQEFAAAIRSAP